MTFSRIWRCERGVAAIEFAVVGVVLIALTIGAFEFGRALFVKHQLSLLADEASRTVMLNPGVSDASLQTTAESDFTAGDPAALAVTLSQETVRGTTYRVVQMDYPITLLVPNLVTNSITVSVTRRIPQL